MSEGLNHWTGLGNLGADPDLKFTQGGTAYLRLRLATTERYLDKDKAWQEKTEWHSVTVFGKRAEALSKFLKKGSRIYVSGPLRTSEYEKDGIKRYSTEVIARQFLFAGGDGGQRRPDPDGPDAPRPPRSADAPPREAGGGDQPSGEPADDFGYGPTGEDEIPFIFMSDATMGGISDPRRRRRRCYPI